MERGQEKKTPSTSNASQPSQANHREPSNGILGGALTKYVSGAKFEGTVQSTQPLGAGHSDTSLRTYGGKLVSTSSQRALG